MSSDLDHAKIPLAQFLKYLTANGSMSMSQAMAFAGKIYKKHSTPAQLRELNDFLLEDCGVSDAGERKLVLSAIRKSGFKPPKRVPKRTRDDTNPEAGPSTSLTSAPSIGGSESATPTALEVTISPIKRKRRRVPTTQNEFLPDRPSDSVSDEATGNLEFNEILDEEVLKSKHAIINRAPVMTAWSMVVAERLNFKRAEALSIASVYTEMNAVSKGVSLGIYESDKERDMQVSRNGTQPYVDLMGRSPLYQTQEQHWQALSNNAPVSPMAAFDYICRSFRQTTPFIIGALKLLAATYTPEELNRRAYSLYCDFRPKAEQWGKRSDLECSKILALRKKSTVSEGLQSTVPSPTVVHADGVSDVKQDTNLAAQMTLEEYEAALDEDHTFDDVDLSMLP